MSVTAIRALLDVLEAIRNAKTIVGETYGEENIEELRLMEKQCHRLLGEFVNSEKDDG